MMLNYLRTALIATALLANAACANAAGIAEQMQQQYQPSAGQPQMTPEQQKQFQQLSPEQQQQYLQQVQQYQLYQQQLQQQYQQQYVPQDNDSDYRLPGQYSPTLNNLRKQFPPANESGQSYQYNKKQYDQNDSGTGHNNYYYQ